MLTSLFRVSECRSVRWSQVSGNDRIHIRPCPTHEGGDHYWAYSTQEEVLHTD